MLLLIRKLVLKREAKIELKILHIIIGLGNGGAERTLSKIVLNLKANHTIISLTSNNTYYQEDLKSYGANVIVFDHKKIYKYINYLLIILREARKAHVIQSWMYHADFIAFFISKLTNRPICWNIRRSSTQEGMSKNTKLLISLNAVLSKKVDKIISCSYTGIENHVKKGYQKEKMIFVPNGISLEKLTSENQKENYKNYFLHVGRYHPVKNHKLLIDSFCDFLKNSESNKNMQLFIVGRDVIKNQDEILQWAGKYSENIKLFNETKDLESLYSEACATILTSKTEGFPNVIVESMSYGTPCISVDAGDSYEIIKDNGFKTKNSPNSISKAMQESVIITKNEYLDKSIKGKKSITENFSLEKMINSYSDIYRELIKNKS